MKYQYSETPGKFFTSNSLKVSKGIKSLNPVWIILLFLFFSQIIHAQSPWLPGAKHYYVQFSYNIIPSYTELFSYDIPAIETPRSVVDQTLQLYGEYGLSDKFSFSASIPYKILETGQINPKYEYDPEEIPEATNVNAFGNVQFSVKYKLLQSKWVSAVQLMVELPASSEKAKETGLYPGYDAFSLAPSASFGRGWNKTYFYAWASYIYRMNNFSDHFDGGIEGGWAAIKNFWIIGYLNLRVSFNNGSRPLPPPEKQLGLYSNNQEYSAYGLKLLYEFDLPNEKKLGIIAHGAGSFSGQYVAKSPLLSLGVYLKK